VFNLANTILGGGISLISLPIAVTSIGLPLFPVIELVVFALNVYTCGLLVFTARALAASGGGHGPPTYQNLARVCLGRRGGLVAPLFILLNNFGVMVGALSVCGDVFSPMVQLPRAPTLLIATAVMLPAAVMVTEIGSLRLVSLLSLAFVGGLVACVAGVAVTTCLLPGSEHYPLAAQPLAGIPGGAPVTWDGVLSGATIVCLSFTCHFNVLPIYRGLDPAVRPSMVSRVIFPSNLVGVVCYIFFGVFAYIAFLSGVDDDILSNLAAAPAPWSAVAAVVRILVVLGLALSFPLFSIEAAHEAVYLAKAMRILLCPTCPFKSPFFRNDQRRETAMKGERRRGGDGGSDSESGVVDPSLAFSPLTALLRAPAPGSANAICYDDMGPPPIDVGTAREGDGEAAATRTLSVAPSIRRASAVERAVHRRRRLKEMKERWHATLVRTCLVMCAGVVASLAKDTSQVRNRAAREEEGGGGGEGKWRQGMWRRGRSVGKSKKCAHLAGLRTAVYRAWRRVGRALRVVAIIGRVHCVEGPCMFVA
jgi:amino acid permease